MKKNFTRFLAALALLVFMAPSMVMWGQTRATVTDELTQSWTGVSGTNYSNWSGKTNNSDAVWAGNSAGGNNSIQLRSNNNNSGIITTTSGGTIKSVSVDWNSNTSNGRTLNVYGKNSAYSSPSNLYNDNDQGTLLGTIVKGTSTSLTISGSYEYIGMRSASGAMYLTKIYVEWETGGGGGSTDPTIFFDSQSANLGIKGVGEEFTTSFTVSQTNLTGDITLTLEGQGELGTTSIEQGADPTEVTWTYTPNEAININTTITATSEGAEPVTFTITGEAKAYHNVIIAPGMANGAITADPTQAYEGQYVTLTIVPATGYELEELTVVDGDDNEIEVDNLYRFQMPDSDVTVNATFVEVAPTIIVTDVLNYEFTGISGSGYKNWSGKTGQSGAVYAGNSNAGVTYIQLRSNNSSGIVSTTSGGKVKKVTVVWNSSTADGRTLNVYGSNTAYESPAALYDASTQGTLLGTIVKGTGNSTELTISSNYAYIGIRSASGAMYLNEIDIDWGTTGTPTCAVPTFNPAAGTYDQTQSVSIACATEGATIYYTLDDTDPTTGSNVYSEALSISETTTVKAMAVKADYNNSAVATATYTIVPPAVATPTFSPAAGVYTEAQSVTINCETDGATIQYKLTENGEWQDYTEALAINETTTVWAKATKEGMTDSEIATAVYTIEEALNTMQAIFDRATEVGNTATSVIIALQNWVVSGVSTNGKNVFVTDGTKGFVIFNNGADMGFAVGDILSGTVSCKVQLYNGFAELTQLNSSTEGISIATGGTVTVADIEMANLAGVNTGALVHYDNLTCSIENNKYYLSDGTTTLQVYNALYAFGSTFEADHVYNITGVYQQYNTNSGDTKEILPRSAADIVEVVSAYITVNPDEINVDGVSQDGYLTIDYDNLDIQGAGDFTIQFYDNNNQEIDQPEWMLEANVTAQVGEEGYFVYYMVGTNEDQIRTAYFKVKVSDIYSNLVTITQTKVVPFINLLAVNDGDDPYVINYTHEISGGYPDKIQHGYFSATSGANSFHIQYYDNEGQPIDAGPDWIEQVTVVDAPSWIPSTYALYVSVFENVGPARTAYFKVWALDNDNNPVYSELVTLNQAAYIVDYATLPFEFDGGRADIDQTAGLTHQGLGSDYSSSPYLKFDTQDDNLVLKINEAPGVLTFAIKGTGNPWTGTFNVQASVDGQTYSNVATYTDDLGDTETKTINNLASGVRYIRWYFTAKASGCNVGVGDIHLAAYEAPQPAITLNSYSIEATAEETEGNLTVTYTEIETSLGASIYWFESDGVTSASEPDWMSASINTQLNVEYLIEENEGAARTAYFKVYGLDSEMNGVYSDLVTVSQAAAPQQYTLEVTSISNAEIIVFDATDPDETNWDYLFEDVDEVQVLGGTPIALSVSAEEGYALTSLMVNSVEHVNDIQGGVYTFTMPAENVTITVTAVESVTPAGGDYVRIIDLSQLTDGSKVIIAARYDADLTDGYYAMPGETSGRPTGVAFTSAISGGNEILPATIVDDEDTYYWTVNVTDDGYTFTNAEDYKIGGKNGTDFVTGGNYIEWTITRQTASDNAMVSEYTGFVIKNGNYERAFAFNGTVFGAYATSNMTNNNASGYNFCLDFFVQQEPVEPVTYTTEMLTGYGEEEGHYYLIASPVYVDPANTNMLTDDNTDPENCTYDLYYFDQSEDDEWRNYRSEAFTLVPGQGYLYANVSDIQLTFTGVPYDGDGVIGLTNTADAEFGGWNLVGNPFGSAATISKAYYAMNAQGSGFEPKTQNDPVAVMQGVFVYTEENSTVTFTKIEQTPVEPEPEANMILNITKDCGSVIDRAIVRFGQSDQLPKFMFNPDNSKVYFTQGNKDYAIVRSAAQGEMPVSFKASKNGTYTLSVEPENVEMNYLHLIDNMTGADVDLLATPSYSFEARTTDYANRFRLVFKANADVEDNIVTETFAYFNGSEWVISNTGDATLQVIDMMGRVLSSEQISGNTAVNINETAGIYMLRLVNGENVMVQKVVVR